ncbi:hypothetical protein A3J90_07065 [candidate division WOR-1 bacterium RIFOXYC2_FULL_37_10]|uniref:Gfo/Idh/MocA-like oxidoreductase N-terminal domain-containing protein n=1 Tax=candidate division WOR-1 bacterium RIFOXYB2_FULL_37_13 TaxID=1802579 RepID=A0A1F4SQ90_UNCSA|nr:MAG: hypothetical protein A2310_07630 [candidate division WOR-1 bacterium RIFOXYB2_FULL_37_13]OGC34244.1 MAG: hypothetical protein A3J90_07065 [candidate division WOR-1 bacterium RIFOXYC2_FULL_37_10]
MKIVIFGLGSIGERHAKLLLDNFDHELFVFRSNKNSIPNSLGIKEIFTWKEIEKIKPDAAFIANPTFLHIKTALKCAELGMHLFIEKPLSHNLDDIDKLASVCRQKKMICYVAYCLRFHPVISKMKKLIENKKIYHTRVVCSSYLPDWRKERRLYDVYSAYSKKGGGVLLDLSHEFDYIQYLFGQIKEIKGNIGRVGNITVDAEDFADVLIKTVGSLYVNLHLNFMSHLNERRIVIDFENGYLIGDLILSKIEFLDGAGVKRIQLSDDRNEYLLSQIQYFFDNLKNPLIINNLKEAKNLLVNILEFKNA